MNMVLMDAAQEPRYLSRDQIDDTKWDRCIDNAVNRIVYGYSSYLDHLSPGWHAIVCGDYEMVMPLTWKEKWGIRYLYQPAFVQQLGIFYAAKVSESELLAILGFCERYFRFAEIALNYHNRIPGTSEKQNFVLDLSPGYETIRQQYKKDLVNNLRVAERYQLQYGSGDLHNALEMYKIEYSRRLPQISDQDYSSFERYCNGPDHHARAVVRKVSDPAGETLAAAVLLQSADRIILNVSVTPAKGKEYSANHFLLDRLIREFAGSGLLLDFEGSDVPGIASFYKTFGTINQPYYFYRYNKLPWLLKLFKK